MSEQRRPYPTDLTDVQWQAIEPFFSHLRVYKWTKRELVNAALYLVDNGCKWRNLPHDFPPYSTVHSFYRRARIGGIWDKIMVALVEITRKNAGKDATPTCSIIDSQSVKNASVCDERGIDGGKKNQGQKTAYRCG